MLLSHLYWVECAKSSFLCYETRTCDEIENTGTAVDDLWFGMKLDIGSTANVAQLNT